MIMGRLADLRESYCERIDVLVALRFPAYYARHDRKVVWLLHQHRQAYDLWDTEFSDIRTWPEGEWLRTVIREHDIRYLSEARRVFTTSQTVSKRLERFTGLDSTPLYHPPPDHELLYCAKFEPFVFYPSWINNMKRQRLLVEAARHLESDMKIVIAGAGQQTELDYLKSMIREHDLEGRVRLAGFISDEEKRNLYANCCCAFFGGYGEDYGYVPLESFYSRKPIVVLDDSGGGREFVEDGCNGYVIPSDAVTLARKLDQLCLDRSLAERLGARGYDRMQELAISWDRVISSLLGAAGV
jgi:glycosyltransferase involved in cell wall biosynthesis